ncbi:Hha toxicity modulator TomB [Xenorhabdus sp. 42]|uniref:Hha toxicity modulator TomB n=1 Tax=Xenorhabdus szentirmaii TaxID=290112 RepID=A0AAW3YQ59_9GAMM|nr:MULTISPECIES: Hha toxicity modulator TomB [unclassified Xenorhabdus]MBD2779484.1 Hha toxicity modulator TomB [Xenorhabdus sp. 38]MBD2790990.1 Hha toxicity modulator TomB [Xenorhabdus sp. CUL]MBD2799161.1 Hha toxicity modulator TomB [Xenorhabdus sp. M]MBD2804026.1 Hha toxicity modulator TomB [Xenorhabdus sp. ZM]MBD2820186.1 Hha toxicity modulator TomB [Xenorhabdus sp. 42]
MDEYSPRRHDIAELKYLCEKLIHEALSVLNRTDNHWSHDLTSEKSLKLNELIEHITAFVWNFKIKYTDNYDLSTLIDDYLDETYNLFGNDKISFPELTQWQRTNEHLANILSHDLNVSLSKT